MNNYMRICLIMLAGILSGVPHLSAMQTGDTRLAVQKRKLEEDDNVLSERPSSLSAEAVVTPYWKKFREMSDKDKILQFESKVLVQDRLWLKDRALIHSNIAAAAYMGLKVSEFPDLLEHALRNDNDELAKILIDHGICEKIKNDPEKISLLFSVSHSAKVAKPLLDAKLPLPRSTLCEVMSDWYDADLIELYRKEGEADPLLPAYDIVPKEQRNNTGWDEETRQLIAPYQLPPTPFRALIRNAASWCANTDKILKKFDALTKGLSQEKLILMTTYGADEGKNLMQELRREKGAVALALLQRVEQKMAELGIQELAA